MNQIVFQYKNNYSIMLDVDSTQSIKTALLDASRMCAICDALNHALANGFDELRGTEGVNVNTGEIQTVNQIIAPATPTNIDFPDSHMESFTVTGWDAEEGKGGKFIKFRGGTYTKFGIPAYPDSVTITDAAIAEFIVAALNGRNPAIPSGLVATVRTGSDNKKKVTYLQIQPAWWVQP